MTPSKSRSTSFAPPSPRRFGGLVTLVVAFGLLGAVYLLPPDTSLSQVQKSGRLVACMPERYGPLVTGDAAAPGFDVELLKSIADRMGVNFSVNTNSAIGRDFNPANWRVNRAQCQVLAGGVVVSNEVRSFLDTLPTPLSTGWAVVSRTPIESLEGAEVGFFSGLTGLDRTGLARYLRTAGIKAHLVDSIQDLEAELAAGTIEAGISEAIVASQLGGSNSWTVRWMPESFERCPLGLGLWRGDLTLQRAIGDALSSLEAEGLVAALMTKYDISPIERTLGESD